MHPVTVTKMSPKGAAWSMGITRKPFMVASRALKGSISVTITSVSYTHLDVYKRQPLATRSTICSAA